MKYSSGVSVIVNAGRYGGFYHHVSLNGPLPGVRICLGWVAFTVYFKDVDDVFGQLAGLPPMVRE